MMASLPTGFSPVASPFKPGTKPKVTHALESIHLGNCNAVPKMDFCEGVRIMPSEQIIKCGSLTLIT